MKIAINADYGGFGLSDAAYIRMIQLGIPCRKYVPQKRDPITGLVLPEPLNVGLVIFDRELTPFNEQEPLDKSMRLYGRYWDTYFQHNRTEYRMILAIEELGPAASSRLASVKVVEIPDGVDFVIEEYDGKEWIAEKHRTWR